MVRYLLVIFCLSIFSVLSVKSTEYMLESGRCGSEHEEEGDRLYSQPSNYYNNNENCELTLVAPKSDQLIMINIIWIDTEYGHDYLSLYDSDDRFIRSFSGYYSNIGPYVSIGRTMKLRFTSDSSIKDDGFYLVFSAVYPEGSSKCDEDDIRCSRYCLDDDLACDNDRNCRYGEDEDGCPLVGWEIALIVIGCISLLLIVSSIVACCVKSQKNKKRTTVTANCPTVSANVVAYPLAPPNSGISPSIYPAPPPSYDIATQETSPKGSAAVYYSNTNTSYLN